MTDGIERLRRAMDEAGWAERTGIESSAQSRLTIDLDPDDRLASHRCGVCLRSIDPRRKRKMAPREFACGACWLLRDEQLGEAVYRHWFSMPPEIRRRRLAQHYGTDPLSRRESPTEVEWLSAPLDVDGMPTTVEVEHYRGRLPTVGVPRSYWDIAAERGWL